MFWPVLLCDQQFSRYKVGENQKCTELPQAELEHLTIKSTLYILYILTTESQILVSFALRLAVSKMQTCTRSAKIGNAPNAPKLNLNTWQSKLLYIHHKLTPEAKFWSVALYSQRFPRYRTFYNLPLTTHYHVKRPNKEQKNSPKFKISNVTILLKTFWRPSPGVYMNLGEQIWCVLSEEISFVTFAPIWSHVNETEKKETKWQKSKISNF